MNQCGTYQNNKNTTVITYEPLESTGPLEQVLWSRLGSSKRPVWVRYATVVFEKPLHSSMPSTYSRIYQQIRQCDSLFKNKTYPQILHFPVSLLKINDVDSYHCAVTNKMEKFHQTPIHVTLALDCASKRS